MCWFKHGKWKVGIATLDLLLLLIFTVLIPLSASAYAGASGLATPTSGVVQSTPTIDATITALDKEKLTQEIQQLKSQNENPNNWLGNNSTALIAAVATVIVALFGILQWAITVRQAQDKDRKDRADAREKEVAAQDKELRAQAEERFKTAVAALGDEKESVKIGGAILLRSFLNPEDEKIYGRYYAQIFDLAVANLCPSETPNQPADPDTPVTLTTLRQALIAVFKGAYPLARSRNKGAPQSLDASYIQLDNGYLSQADLKQAWMPQTSLRKSNLSKSDLTDANLSGASLRGVNLNESDLRGANLSRADLRGAKLYKAKLNGIPLDGAKLNGAMFSEADLSGATFSDAILYEANFDKANLQGANLSGSFFNSRTILCGANLSEANLYGVNLNGADLRMADLSGASISVTTFDRADLAGANLSGVLLENAQSFRGSNLRGVHGLTREQLVFCKAKGAIINEDTTTGPPPDTNGSSDSVSQQSNAEQISPIPSAPAKIPPVTTDGSNAAASQQHPKASP